MSPRLRESAHIFRTSANVDWPCKTTRIGEKHGTERDSAEADPGDPGHTRGDPVAGAFLTAWPGLRDAIQHVF